MAPALGKGRSGIDASVLVSHWSFANKRKAKEMIRRDGVPKRILHVVTHMNRGGLETMLMNYYRNIDRSGLQFDFLTHRPYDGDYGEEIKELGGTIYHLPLLNPFSPHYFKALDRFFAEHPYEIVHSHLDCMSYYPLSRAKKAGMPWRIAHAHNTSQEKNLKYLMKLAAKKKIPQVTTDLFACGEAAGKWMFGENEFHVMRNAIDARKYRYAPEIRRSIRNYYHLESAFVLGHVGRFNPQKNHAYLIDVFHQVSIQDDAARLLLVGGGDGEKEIRKKVAALHLQDKVIFAGVCPNVHELLQAMDVFVFPSIFEGLPVTLIEAQASGLPCVISSVVTRECAVTDLANYIDLGKDSEWIKAILDCREYKRTDRYDEIRLAGYDIEENAKKLTDYYFRVTT